jgi:DNA mismatch repair ATPase MutS
MNARPWKSCGKRQTASDKLRRKYEAEFQELRDALRNSLENLKDVEKSLRKQGVDNDSQSQLADVRASTRQLLESSDC